MMICKRICLSFLLLSIVVFGLLSPAQVTGQSRADQRKAKALNDQGDKAYRAKNLAEAIRFYTEAAQIMPANAHSHYWKANAHYELKQYAEAERDFALALSQGFRPIDVFKIRWFLFHEQKNYDAAIADLKKALEIEPRNVQFLNGLGDSHRLKRQYPEAIAAYRRSAAVAPKNGDIDVYIAVIHSENGDHESQLTAAQDAIKKGTRLIGEAYYLAGDGLQRKKMYAGAAAAYERAIAATPLKFEPYRNLAAIHQRQGRLKDAILVMERAKAAINGDGRIFLDLAWYYSLADRKNEAVGSAQAAVKLLPNDYLSYTNLCRALNDTNQHAQASIACNNALRRNPGDGETVYYRGRASDFMKRTAEATRYYKQAVTGLTSFAAANPEYAEGHYLLGGAYFADGQRDRAVAAFRRAVELNPNFSKARANLGRVYVALGNKSAALEQHRILLSQDAALASQLKTAIDQM